MKPASHHPRIRERSLHDVEDCGFEVRNQAFHKKSIPLNLFCNDFHQPIKYHLVKGLPFCCHENVHDREYMIVQRNMDSEELIKTDWHDQESSIKKKEFCFCLYGKEDG